MNEQESAQTTLLVQEGENIRIPCVAEGIPPPKYSWKRLDNKPIRIGHWSSESWIRETPYKTSLTTILSFPSFTDSALEGPVLNITRVRREHFGSYVCFANNGVPPPASHQVNLEITCKLLVSFFRVVQYETFSRVLILIFVEVRGQPSTFSHATTFAIFFSIFLCASLSFSFLHQSLPL